MGVKDDLKTFLIHNGVFAYVAGFVIALTVKDLIESFMGDLLIPVVNHFLFHLHLKHFSKYLPGNDKVNGRRLTREFLTFVTTFIILYVMFVNLIQPMMN